MMRNAAQTIAIFALPCASLLHAAPSPYASAAPLREPTVFAPGVISTGDYESHPAFTPDGATLYFLKDSPGFHFWTIFVSRFADGRWSEPQLAPFSGQYRDADPFITPDGQRFFFISDRPVPGKTHHDLDIWTMQREGDGWNTPRNLGAPVNSDGQEWYPTVAADGTLYFGSDRAGGKGHTDIWRARFADGKYAEPENLGAAINTAQEEYEPWIAPDQSYLLFMADNRDGRGDSDIFISWNCANGWTKAEPLGAGVNSSGSEYSPKLSPDGRYFFWTSTRTDVAKLSQQRFDTDAYLKRIRSLGNGLGDIYQIDLDALKLRSPCASEARSPMQSKSKREEAHG
jgi:Tol biopolymer transport system component